MTIEPAIQDQFTVEQSGEIKMRLGFGMTLFLPRPFQLAREGVFDLWKHYLNLIQPTPLSWARLGGGNRSRPVAPAAYKTIASWLDGSKNPGQDCWIIISDGKLDCMGSTAFELEGLGPVDSEEDNASGFVEISLPLSFVESRSADEIAGQMVALAENVPFLCGTAGFIFQRSPYAFNTVADRMAALSARFEGVDVTGNVRMRYWATHGLPNLNWMTFIGDTMLEKLGGRQTLARLLPPACSANELSFGMVCRASEAPSLGDRHRGTEDLAPWRDLNSVLQPIRYVSPRAAFHPRLFDRERTQAWLTRFDPK